jgi:hypothetical protein
MVVTMPKRSRLFDIEAGIFAGSLDLSFKVFPAQCLVLEEALASSLQCRPLII